MPEVAEVAHVVAQLRRHILGYRIKSLDLPQDLLLFPQIKTVPEPSKTLHQFSTLLAQSTIQNVGRHGKYFWIRTETPAKENAVILMHFGMTGMVKMRGISSHFIMMENGGDKKIKQELLMESGRDLDLDLEDLNLENTSHVKAENIDGIAKTGDDIKTEFLSETVAKPVSSVSETFSNHFASVKKTEEWPPRFTKFQLFLEHPETKNTIDFAFTDPRRLGRVQILSGPEYSTNTGLLENCPSLQKLGPDYSKSENPPKVIQGFTKGDPDPEHHGKPRLDFESFARLVLTKKKPIKAFLLDQEFFAGVGNWVSDEILYQARIFPGENLSSKIDDPAHPVLKRLYESLVYVMEESVQLEGNAREFPRDWLMIHRWGKGRKQPKAKVSHGYSVDFETIGGRTSCFVKELQKPLKRELSGSEPKTEKKKTKTIAQKRPKTEADLESVSDLQEIPTRRRSTRARKSS